MSNIPKIVFIVPYRNRPQHKFFFSNYLTTIMDGRNDYEIYFSHQCDVRAFNRGATKNIGFLAVKSKYPDNYKDITFVFNDIDTIPFSTIIDFETVPGIVKHFYGFTYALGGIVALKGSDFEATNGYPNYWGWGMEDNVLQKRCETIGLTIDRSQFYPIGSPDIIHLFDGVSRIINRKDPWRATHDDGIDGLRTIHKLEFSIDEESVNPLDNIHTVNTDKICIINISTFMTGTRFEHDNYYKYDLREPPRKIIHPDKIRTNKIEHLTDDWTNIPFYPTAEKKNAMIHQYGEQNAEEIIKYSYENSTDPTKEVVPPQMFNHNRQQPHQHQQMNYQQPSNPQMNYQQPSNPQMNYQQPSYQNQIQQYNEAMRQMNSNQRIIPQNINKFSPAYARIIAAKPRATSSANIRLGGVYR
jgi:hypothetical protein